MLNSDWRSGFGALALSVSVLLASCGGGGSTSSDDNDPEGEEVERVSLTGVAVKGILVDALVVASSLDGQTQYGQTETDSSGLYSLTGMNIGSGPVKITLTTQATTTAVCDSASGCSYRESGTDETASFGASYPFHDPDFELLAILPGYAEGVTAENLMVTPLTHLAASRIEHEGAAGAEDIADINRATANLLGLGDVDITALAPSDISNSSASDDSSEAQEYGAIAAGFATVAESKGLTLAELLSQVADDYAQNAGLVANSSDDTRVDLGDLFDGALASLDEAVDSGIQLDNLVAVELLAEQEAADSQQQDQVVSAEISDETDIETQSEATAKAIQLLLDLNEWNTTLTTGTEDSVATAYVDDVEAVTELMPLFDEQAEAIRGLRELLIDESGEHCYEDGSGQLHCEYRETEPGSLFGAASVITQIADLAVWIYANKEELDASVDDDGYRTQSVMALIGRGIDLDIEDFLHTDEEPSEAGTATSGSYDLTARYKVDEGGELIRMIVTGTGPDASMDDSLITMSSGDDFKVDYQLLRLDMTGNDGETFEGEGALSIGLDSAAERTAYLAQSDADDAYQFVSASMDLDTKLKGVDQDAAAAGFTGAQAELGWVLSVTRDVDDTLVVDLDAEVHQTSYKLDELLEDKIDGTLNLDLSGTLAGEVTLDAFIDPSDLSNASVGFEGVLIATTDSADKLEFEGTVDLTSSEFEQDVSLGQQLDLTGTMTATLPDNRVVTLVGELGLETTSVRDASDAIIYQYGDPVYLVESASFAGDLGTGTTDSDVSSVSLSLAVRRDYFDILAQQFELVEMPDYGTEVATVSFEGYAVTTDASNNSATLVFDSDIDGLGDRLITTLEEEGLAGLEISYNATVPETHVYRLSGCVAHAEKQGIDVCTLAADGEIISDNLEVLSEESSSPDLWIASLADRISLGTFVEVEIASVQGFIYLQGGYNTRISEYGSAGNPVDVPLIVLYSETYDFEEMLANAETDTAFIGVAASAILGVTHADLEEGRIQVSAARTGIDEEDIQGSIQLSYGDRSIELTVNSLADFTDGAETYLHISDGTVTMAISATCVDLENEDNVNGLEDCTGDINFGGDIHVGDFKVGELEDRDGVPVFVFEDGSDYQLVVTPNFLASEL